MLKTMLNLLLRLIGIFVGPITGMMFGIIGGFIHFFTGDCVAFELGLACPGWWFHPIAVAVCFPLAIIILSLIFEDQDLYEVIGKQNNAYFSSSD